jgi:hypothetical protein
MLMSVAALVIILRIAVLATGHPQAHGSSPATGEHPDRPKTEVVLMLDGGLAGPVVLGGYLMARSRLRARRRTSRG